MDKLVRWVRKLTDEVLSLKKEKAEELNPAKDIIKVREELWKLINFIWAKKLAKILIGTGEPVKYLYIITQHTEADERVTNGLFEIFKEQILEQAEALSNYESVSLSQLNQLHGILLDFVQKNSVVAGSWILFLQDFAASLPAITDKETAVFEKIPGLNIYAERLYNFSILLELDDRAIQLLLREIQSDSLILALKGTTEDLREKIFKNMSQRAAEMLREDLESKWPVRQSEVENEQKSIMRILIRLADEWQAVIPVPGEKML